MNAHAELIYPDEVLFVVVDIQKSMFELCNEKERVAENVRSLLQLSDILSIPVLFTEHYPEKLGAFLSEFVKLAPNSPVLKKVEFSCLENQIIRETIEKNSRKTLVVTGIETHVCIFQTVAQALHQGYRVQVISDAVTARSAANHQIGLKRMCKAGAVISSTEMAIFELLKKAGTDNFRKALPIIKK